MPTRRINTQVLKSTLYVAIKSSAATAVYLFRTTQISKYDVRKAFSIFFVVVTFTFF